MALDSSNTFFQCFIKMKKTIDFISVASFLSVGIVVFNLNCRKDNQIENKVAVNFWHSFVASTIRPDDCRTKETRHRRAHERAVFHIHHLFVAGEDMGAGT